MGCVIWGAGESAQDLYCNNRYFRENDGIIVDHNSYKQQKGFYGKEVFAPEVFAKRPVDNVVCCMGNVNYEYALREAKECGYRIKRMIWIYDLLLDK